MLVTLLDGRAYTAKELAWAADITPQTTSFHLRKLSLSKFIKSISQGRHRYFRLANEEVAQALEGLLALHVLHPTRPVPSTCPEHLLEARYCYNHLAGRVGVGICRMMLRNTWIVPGKQGWVSTLAVAPLFDKLSMKGQGGALPGRLCLDWSEREYHLGGELGSTLLKGMLNRHWLRRGDGRVLKVTADGKRQLASLGTWIE